MKSTLAALIALCSLTSPGLAETPRQHCNPTQISDRCVQARQQQLDKDLYGKPLSDPGSAPRFGNGPVLWSDMPRSMPYLRRL